MIPTIALRVACATLALGLTTLTANAALLVPDFANVPTGWSTDRFEPGSFSNVGAYQGRDNVLAIGIGSAQGSANRPGGQQNDFYNTQGRQHAVSGGGGSILAADLFIESAWRDGASGNVRSDIWGVSDNAPLNYPIIGFTNHGTAGARYRVWDADTANGWVDLLTPVSFDAWTSFAIEFTGSAYVFSINGATVYTDNTIGTSTGFSAVIMQAYNFNDSQFDNGTATGFVGVDYVAHWDNARLENVPEPASLALAAVALLGMSSLRRKMTR